MIFHVLNRGNERREVFASEADFDAMLRVIRQTLENVPLDLFAFCLMPNHWHLVVRPKKDGDLGRFMQRLTTTHVRRWRQQRELVGAGHLYQGTYKSFPVQSDEHFLTVCRYVERNPQRAGLVARAKDWRWSSLWILAHGSSAEDPSLATWPVSRGESWIGLVQSAQSEKELAALRASVQRGRPFGSARWQASTVRQLGLQFTLRARGRPRKSAR